MQNFLDLMQKLITVLTSLKPKEIELLKFIEKIPEFWEITQQDIFKKTFHIADFDIKSISVLKNPAKFRLAIDDNSDKVFTAFWKYTSKKLKENRKEFQIENKIQYYINNNYVNGFEPVVQCKYSLMQNRKVQNIEYEYFLLLIRNNDISLVANLLTAQIALQNEFNNSGLLNGHEIVVPFTNFTGDNLYVALKSDINGNITLCFDKLSLKQIIHPNVNVIILGSY